MIILLKELLTTYFYRERGFMKIKNYSVLELNNIKISVDKSKEELFIKKITQKNEEIKKKLGLRNDPINFTVSNGIFNMKFTGITGSVNLGEIEIEVVPKFITEQNKLWRKSVFNFINIANSKWVLPEKLFNLGTDKSNFYDHLALLYIDILSRALTYDPIQTYNSSVIESKFLRGRLLINEQLSQILSKPGLVVSEVDYYNTENEYNYLINWTLGYLNSRVKDLKLKIQLNKLKEEIPQTNKLYNIPILKPLPAQYIHYKEVVDFGNLIATGNSISLNPGNQEGYGYILNTEKLYEGFIESILKKMSNFDNEWVFIAQSSKKFVTSINTQEKEFYTIPDNKLIIQGEPVMLIDAKYKASKNIYKNKRPINSDLYQLFSSLVSHNCHLGLLIHPWDRSTENKNDLSVWHLKFQESDYFMGSYSLDLSDLSDAKKVNYIIEELREKINFMLKK